LHAKRVSCLSPPRRGLSARCASSLLASSPCAELSPVWSRWFDARTARTIVIRRKAAPAPDRARARARELARAPVPARARVAVAPRVRGRPRAVASAEIARCALRSTPERSMQATPGRSTRAPARWMRAGRAPATAPAEARRGVAIRASRCAEPPAPGNRVNRSRTPAHGSSSAPTGCSPGASRTTLGPESRFIAASPGSLRARTERRRSAASL